MRAPKTQTIGTLYQVYKNKVCACAQRNGAAAAARESLRRDRPGELTSPVCGSAMLFAQAVVTVTKISKTITPSQAEHSWAKRHKSTASTCTPCGLLGALFFFPPHLCAPRPPQRRQPQPPSCAPLAHASPRAGFVGARASWLLGLVSIPAA